MQAGQLDKRVMVQIRSLAKGASGEEVELWTNERKIWMGKRDIRATERFTGAETVAEVETVFKARWASARELRQDTHRLVYPYPVGTIYAILGRTELGRRDALEFPCAARGEAKYAPDVHA